MARSSIGSRRPQKVVGVSARSTTNRDPHQPDAHPFLLNGEPVFINGIAEYEHRIGNSHAFTSEEIRARVAQIRAGRLSTPFAQCAHQPCITCSYQHYWDNLGILWWPQPKCRRRSGSYSPAFRPKFQDGVCQTEWVKRTAQQSLPEILWGLQNAASFPKTLPGNAPP